MAERYIHISRVDGEGWLPMDADYVRGRIDVENWVLLDRWKFHVAKLDSGRFVAIGDDAVKRVARFGSLEVPVAMLALTDWPEWFGSPEPFLAPGTARCNVVINDRP